MYDSTDRKCPEQAHPETEGTLVDAKGWEGLGTANEYGVAFGGMRMFCN